MEDLNGDKSLNRRHSRIAFDKKNVEAGGDGSPKIMQSTNDLHHSKGLKRATTIRAKSAKVQRNQQLNPMETIENIKAAIAEIDLKAKVKGIMSKAMATTFVQILLIQT